MFTTRKHLGIRKIEVKWQNSTATSRPLSEYQESTSLQEKAEKAQKNLLEFSGDITDHTIMMRLLKNFQEANEAFARKNEKQAAELDNTINSFIDKQPDGEAKTKMSDFRTQRKNQLKGMSDAQTVAIGQAKEGSHTNQLRVQSEVVTQRDQVKVLEEILKKDNSHGANVLLSAITATPTSAGEATQNTIQVQLSDTTLGSVILTLLTLHKKNPNLTITEEEFKKSYVSNGAYWFGDKQAVQKLLDIFNDSKNRADIIKVFSKLAPTYQALGTTVHYAKNSEKVGTLNRSNLLDELAKLPRFAGDANMEKKLLELFKTIPQNELTSRIKGIIALGGGTMGAENIDGVVSAFKVNPSLLSSYHAGMNLLGNSGPMTLGNYLRTGKFELAPDMASLQKDILSIVATARKEAVEKINASSISDGEKKKALGEIDTKFQALNTPESLRAMAYHASAVLTNKGIGLSGGISMEAKSAISDQIMAGLFAGMAQGGAKDIGASLMASKNLVRSKDASFDVFYGIAASRGGVLPTLGAGGSYKDILYSLYTNKLGAGVFLGMKTGNNQESAEIVKNIAATPEAVKEMIEAGLKDQNNFKIDTGNPANNQWINARIQTLLNGGNYTTLTPEQKPIALHTALLDAVREKAYMVKEMIKDNEWGLSAIGVNFGKFAGLTFVLPGFSWSKTETFHMSQAVEGTGTPEQKTSANYTFTRQSSNLAVATFQTPLPTDVIIPQGVSISGDRKQISGLDKNTNIKIHIVDGKLAIQYTDAFGMSNTESATPAKKVEMKEVLSDTKIRSALSYFAAVVDKKKAGELILRIDQNINTENPETLLLLGKEFATLLSKSTGDKGRDGVIKTLLGDLRSEDFRKVTLQIRKIRDALMTDRSQSATIGSPRAVQKGESTNKDYLAKMLNSDGFKQAIKEGGMESEDFSSLNPQNPEGIGYTPTLDTAMIGAVASWKFEPAHMAYLPTGAVWMSSEPVVTNKRQEVLATLEKANGSILESELQKSASTMKSSFGREVTIEEMKNLLLGKTIENGTKKLTLDAKFYTFCYGSCMNPSVGLKIGNFQVVDLGKPTFTGQATLQSTISGSGGNSLSFSSGDAMNTWSLFAGGARQDKAPQGPATTDPDKTDVTGTNTSVNTGGTGGSANRPGTTTGSTVSTNSSATPGTKHVFVVGPSPAPTPTPAPPPTPTPLAYPAQQRPDMGSTAQGLGQIANGTN